MKTTDDLGGNPSLDGWHYQCDVSVLAALDLLVVNRVAKLLQLEPATQEDLEARIGKSQTEKGYISRLETGAIETPPFEVIQKIADALQFDVIEFFFAEGLDESPEDLIKHINELLPVQDVKQLRKIYRLILVDREKYSR